MKNKSVLNVSLALCILSFSSSNVFGFTSAAAFASETRPAERDPTRPAIRDSERAGLQGNRLSNFKLNLIRYSSQGSVAVINNEHFHIGDELNGWIIRSIEADRVLLMRDNEIVVLSVFSGITRTSLRDGS
ncbi:MAG: hypothetical protein LAT53_06375 [Idiomarina sp.]|nr:hypothetical protein [Idiomarina sp.]